MAPSHFVLLAVAHEQEPKTEKDLVKVAEALLPKQFDISLSGLASTLRSMRQNLWIELAGRNQGGNELWIRSARGTRALVNQAKILRRMLSLLGEETQKAIHSATNR